jgi:hypothetical protein
MVLRQKLAVRTLDFEKPVLGKNENGFHFQVASIGSLLESVNEKLSSGALHKYSAILHHQGSATR